MLSFPKKLCCLDFETTGPNPEVHEIIQIGCIWLDQELNELKRWSTLVQPESSNFDKEAMEVHKISVAELMRAPVFADAITKWKSEYPDSLVDVRERWSLASWGIYFDVPFVDKLCGRNNIYFPFEDPRFKGVIKAVDIKSIVMADLAKKGSHAQHIKGALEFYGLDFDGPEHDALNDIHNSIRALKKALE